MKLEDFDGEYIKVKQDKTGADLWVYCPERLRLYLDSLPQTGGYILAKNLTEHIGKRCAQALVEGVRREIDATAFVVQGGA